MTAALTFLRSLLSLIIFPFKKLLHTIGLSSRSVSPTHRHQRIQTILIRLYSWPQDSSSAAQDLGETAWLNGVRGLAAVLVMFHHLNGDIGGMPVSMAPFGATLARDVVYNVYAHYPANHRFLDLWRLPLVRLLFMGGDAQVAVFFVLSSFVLAWQPMRMIYAGKTERMSAYLGSLLFRRWLRLFPPCIAISCLYFLVDLFWNKSKRSSFGALRHEVLFFLDRMENWVEPFNVDVFKSLHHWNTAMWTIPWEYGGSIFLVLVLLAVSRIQNPPIRMLFVTGFSLYASATGWWAFTLFGSGIVLCDYVLYNNGFAALAQNVHILARVSWTACLLLGLYILGYGPSPAEALYTTPGYTFMASFSESAFLVRYWCGIGAILTMTSVCHFPRIQRLFDTKLLQYMGRISFMLYLVHNFIISNFSIPLWKLLHWIFESRRYDEQFKTEVYTPGAIVAFLFWLTCMVFTTALTFLVANWLEIYLDAPCTKFSRWIDKTIVNVELPSSSKVNGTAVIQARHVEVGRFNGEEVLPLHKIDEEAQQETRPSSEGLV